VAYLSVSSISKPDQNTFSSTDIDLGYFVAMSISVASVSFTF